MSEFVDELPKKPKIGDTVWLSLGKPGFWAEMQFDGTDWVQIAGMAVPHIPKDLYEK
jgi:hypothetical protein